ncbi:HAD-IA family hydrolase [Bosea sp. TAF32]|uniref:HAD-IA family hydrolase n=1 Tax=Bosea sp. TAF32 TaxID=3237482 RepID=UPI003F8D9E89
MLFLSLLVLETSTLMRLSAVLGVFADLRRVLGAASRARDERRWLLEPQQLPPFNGRRPLEVLSEAFEEQMTVRRYLAAVAGNADFFHLLDMEALSPSKSACFDNDAGVREIKAVCFDGFGTVVEIGDKRRPFHALLERERSETLTRRAITQPMSLRQLSEELSAPITEEQLADIEADLEAELVSVRLRPGMRAAWQAIRQAGLKIAVCSNLASPYEAPLVEQLPGEPDALILSFRAKLMKPQPEIYELVCGELGLRPREVLFVGDTLHADVIGPSTIGAFAMPISEFERSFEGGASFFAPHLIAELFGRIKRAEHR